MLNRVRGVGPQFIRKHGQEMLALIQASHPEPAPHPNATKRRPPDDVLARYEHLRLWRNTTAHARGVEPDVILSNAILMRLAKANPDNSADLARKKILASWEFETYAQDLIEQLKELA
jgi:ribonuclease D